jgi:hypothetical protein
LARGGEEGGDGFDKNLLFIFNGKSMRKEKGTVKKKIGRKASGQRGSSEEKRLCRNGLLKLICV